MHAISLGCFGRAFVSMSGNSGKSPISLSIFLREPSYYHRLVPGSRTTSVHKVCPMSAIGMGLDACQNSFLVTYIRSSQVPGWGVSRRREETKKPKVTHDRLSCTPKLAKTSWDVSSAGCHLDRPCPIVDLVSIPLCAPGPRRRRSYYFQPGVFCSRQVSYHADLP